MSHIWVLLFCVVTPTLAQYGDEQPPIEENPCNLVDCIPNTRCIVVNGEAKCVPLNGYGDKDCETPEPENPTCATVLCKPPTTCVLRPKNPGCRDNCPLEAACVIPVRSEPAIAPKRTYPPAQQKCPANEQFNECGSACEPSCKNPKPEFCTEQCVIGCQCKPGFFRNDQKVCVAKCSETSQQQCKANEQFTDCGSACEPSCKNPKPEVCTLQCVVGCQCKPGFFRNDQNACVAKCPGGGAGTCGLNEERKQCGTACEPTCANPNPGCTKQCIIDVCQCKQGYIRDANKKCIPVEQCPKDRIIPCSEMNCPKGTVCELGRVICPFVPPCFTRQTKCVPLTPEETCATKKCPPGTVCEQETIFCIRAPCPQPKPQCVKKG
ncbi:hypothetical protein Y032_0198g1640 [Ancylostoma ceylanicum]|uniref:TIL domain-containing protein n=1 Tax=Ancylostoma ceylanicum TaxID=53326 RepID=A0A016SP44_9BILA|nr:hypothetical protein Y032_0198g1640 [Ancylostoma ceylanicum]